MEVREVPTGLTQLRVRALLAALAALTAHSFEQIAELERIFRLEQPPANL